MDIADAGDADSLNGWHAYILAALTPAGDGMGGGEGREGDGGVSSDGQMLWRVVVVVCPQRGRPQRP